MREREKKTIREYGSRKKNQQPANEEIEHKKMITLEQIL